jgi:pyrroline-5-carboxylate reductase
MSAIVFLGGGRITSALLAGLRLAKYRQPIIVHDHDPRKLRDLQRAYGVDVEPDLHRAVDQAKLLIIAVRPDSVGELLRHVGFVEWPLGAVSLAAGVPLSRLRAGLRPPVRWARAMPSPACRSGRGLTGVTFDRNFPSRCQREVCEFFSEVGPVLEIPESKFDAFTVTYSCSRGYHALATMAAAAQELGLDRKTALTAAAHALADGIVAWREGDTSLDALIEEAATPGGIAAAVMDAMDRAGYARVIKKGLEAGRRRARRNAKMA